MNFVQFFQSPEGENSSKRLVGLSAAFVFELLSFIGALTFLILKDFKNFLDLVELVGYFSSYHLTTGLADHFFKKRSNS